MIETPPWLDALSKEQQSATPYLGLGFEKAEVPEDIHARLLDEVKRCADRFRPAPSSAPVRSVERAIIPVVHLEDRPFVQEIACALQGSHEAWAGMRLRRSAAGGLRAYQRGSYVLVHADRTGDDIISSTLCVHQKLDESWPLRIEAIDGRVHELNLAPGELVFYEGARLVHGRPWPLRGDYYLCLTLHYRPEGLGFSPRAGLPQASSRV
jgi:prolyl 4-hydroxylase